MKILLSKIMYKRNLSARQIAILSNITKSSVQKIMNEDSNPTIRTLEKLAAGLGCRITDLFESDFK
jgi:transcriptional regulator with XRE-family HTH domain|nr:MAG TPA: helix-turn-helix domain protein [Caudoviricetes sp.]